MLFLFIWGYMLVHFNEATSAACFRWTQPTAVCCHGSAEKWVRDGAVGVHSDEKELVSDLRPPHRRQ